MIGSALYSLATPENNDGSASYGAKSVFACTGEKGHITLFNLDDPLSCVDNQEDLQFYKRVYYKDFPSNHKEVQSGTNFKMLKKLE